MEYNYKNGEKPEKYIPFSMNYYLNQRVTKKIGTDDLSNYELVKGENPVSNFLREN